MQKNRPTDKKAILDEHIAEAKSYVLEGDDKVAYDLFTKRRDEMQEFRKDVHGVNIENIWKAADRAYVPHTLEMKAGRKAFASDDELGWRSIPITIGENKSWQENSVPVNPYVKINTALNILVDRNPEAVFKAFSDQYEGASLLHAELYKRNWDYANSRQVLKNVILNGAKYGILCLKNFPLIQKREVRNLEEFNPADPSKNKYSDHTITVYDDVYRKGLNPWTTWFDESAKPGMPMSLNDWCHYDEIGWWKARELFGHLKNWKYVVPIGSEAKSPNDKSDVEEEGEKKHKRTDTVKFWYYENLEWDLYLVCTDSGIVLINEPIAKKPENKMLMCSVAPWSLRSSETIYGIGLYELMRNDYKIYLKVRNMSVDQLALSIYKGFFFQGPNTLESTGKIALAPGEGKQISNPKDINWNIVPGPGREVQDWMDRIKNDIDDATGIVKTLEGELSPNAKAFDIAQAREAALKRLKGPLGSIGYLLEQDAYISVANFEEMYSLPEVYTYSDIDTINTYKEMLQNKELPDNVEIFEDSQVNEETGEPIDSLEVHKYRRIGLHLDRDDDGNIQQSEEEMFFSLKPKDLPWKGIIQVTGQSILVESPLLERQEKLEMSNLLLPLFAQPPQLYLSAAKQIIKIYKEEAKDWLPETWLQFEEMKKNPPPQPLFVNPMEGQAVSGVSPQGMGSTPFMGANEAPAEVQAAQKVVPAIQAQPRQRSLVGRAVQKIISPFNRT